MVKKALKLIYILWLLWCASCIFAPRGTTQEALSVISAAITIVGYIVWALYDRSKGEGKNENKK